MNVEISVIIASMEGIACLGDCLAALSCQSFSGESEVIVAARAGDPVIDFVKRTYPHVVVLECDCQAGVPELRGAAMSVAEGKIIALTEDHCIAPNNWLESLSLSHSANASAAIGGCVVNGACRRLIDWAVFYMEYGRFLAPLKTGPVEALPGPNASYKRQVFATLEPGLMERFWDWSVHERLKESGQVLWNDSSITMLHTMHFSLRQYLKERYFYSRDLSRMRREREGNALLRILSTPLLPPLILSRVAMNLLVRPRHWMRFFLTIPYLVLFSLVWAAGELAGYCSLEADFQETKSHDFAS